MAKRKKTVPKDETKRDKFKRVVEPRVKKALKAIQLIGNCAGSAYDYTEDDVSFILAALSRACESLGSKYVHKGVYDDDFTLD